MENTTTTCEVIVDGKRLMLSSEKNIEHLNRIAVYLNGKIKQVKSQQFYRSISKENADTIVELNLADDVISLKTQIEDLEEEKSVKNDEIFSLKHEIIELKSKLAELESENQKLREDKISNEKEIIKLETELDERAKKNNNNGNRK
ncbi:MAG TPA: cell division protein ZapA [Lachnospiraceae bacterium]|jgi:cell division protein ZapA|nr:cell division protein ZapA [Lachnospiraceae bacterium]